MSIRALKLLHDVGWIFTVLPLALMSFDVIYSSWIIIINFIGIFLMIIAYFVSKNFPEARLNDELIQNETKDYYKKYPWRPISVGIIALFGLMLPFIKEQFNLKDSQIIYLALFLWYMPHMIGNALFGGRRALRSKARSG
ncbi:hypothetical protein ASE66_07515 [Bosea sp. Root483D1]|uniref:hypothetical protein n=1 Tax=Bosea sp. Root483D1 TaxID=1736544 RepID=UPI00070A75BA|nr:hypothetical protein [Bosea sp. Root483D1]KRE20687.1 hypothetical protein ASE66_07515 [Bosea sp. Root483D1]